MPLYLDRHDGVDLTPEELARIHLKDLEIQERYGARYITYWFDPELKTGFCLVEAPSAQAAEEVHRNSHGIIANRIIEVDPRGIDRFLGPILEPEPGDPIANSAIRTILFTDMEGSTTLTQRLGDVRAMDVLRSHDEIVREGVRASAGHEIKHTGDGIMSCFTSVVRSLECAIWIQRRFAQQNEARKDEPIRVRVGLSAGEPVTEHKDLFGAAVQLAARICSAADPGSILASNVVKELSIGKDFRWVERGETSLRGFTEGVRLYQLDWTSEEEEH